VTTADATPAHSIYLLDYVTLGHEVRSEISVAGWSDSDEFNPSATKV
jgi:GH18 family chitinase